MRPEEYALWDVSRKLSHATGILYFDGRELANLFDCTAKNRIYRAAKSLITKGWYEVISKTKRDSRTGLFKPAQYRVLSPQEWCEKHPHTCRMMPSSPETGNGSDSEPVPKTGTSSPETGTYIDKENSEKRDTDTASQAPLAAAQLAFNTFCQDMASKDAFDLLLWILFRCSRAKKAPGQVPQSVDYYLEARRNFRDGVGRDEFESTMLDSAVDRFKKFTAGNIKDRCAALWDWLNETYNRVTEEAASAAA